MFHEIKTPPRLPLSIYFGAFPHHFVVFKAVLTRKIPPPTTTPSRCHSIPPQLDTRRMAG